MKNGCAPIRLSYQHNSHYNAIIDPYNATVGVGLGLAGYKPELQTAEALRLSEQLEIEQTMFEDKLKTTDWEATNEAIEEQIARESYLQWCRDNLQKSRTDVTATITETTTTITSSTITSEKVTKDGIGKDMTGTIQDKAVAAAAAAAASNQDITGKTLNKTCSTSMLMHGKLNETVDSEKRCSTTPRSCSKDERTDVELQFLDNDDETSDVDGHGNHSPLTLSRIKRYRKTAKKVANNTSRSNKKQRRESKETG